MKKRRCAACHRLFCPRAQAPRQQYCSAPCCQRERRRRWQQGKRRSDPDYRENERRAQRSWAERHPEYWRGYRAEHPTYVEANRVKQRERDRRRRERRRADGEAVLAKSDASTLMTQPLSGTYRLIPVTAGLAKKNAWTVEIHGLPTA
jgi:hypothetical protein